VGFILLEGPINVFPQIHPDMMRTDLYGEMLAVAEAKLSGKGADGRRKVYVWADSQDTTARGFLEQRGFVRHAEPNTAGRQGRQDLDRDISPAPVPAGYSVRNQNLVEDLASRNWCSWKAFHPDQPDEKYEGWLWYRNIQKAPLYRNDLDIVATDPEGDIVSFCTVWYDPATETAHIEPVGTHPDHQRKGLGLACITEGLHRLRKLGCRRAFLEGFSVPAKALYDKAGFHDFDVNEPWVRFLD